MKTIKRNWFYFLATFVIFMMFTSSCEKEDINNNNEINSILTDIDGNVYNTVRIGNQTWMAENLKTTHYADGTEIQLVESSISWDALGDSDIAMCYYDNSSANADTYGALYNWAAAMNSATTSAVNASGVQGACPDGWHLPSDAEWTELTDYLGGLTVAGDKMKETGTSHWISPNAEATNEVGFTVLPGGYRYYSGWFNYLNYHAFFWSATEHDGSTLCRRLTYEFSIVYRCYGYKGNGYSVRCIKD